MLFAATHDRTAARGCAQKPVCTPIQQGKHAVLYFLYTFFQTATHHILRAETYTNVAYVLTRRHESTTKLSCAAFCRRAPQHCIHGYASRERLASSPPDPS